MSESTLIVEAREGTGKGVARKLRRDGRIPGVIYGGDREPMAVSVNERDLFRTYQAAGTHSLVDLQIDGGDNGGRHKVLIKDVQIHPVRGEFVHVDFHAVALDQEMQTTVPVEVQGEERRTDDGVVQLVLREINISCLPTDIPESIAVDVSEMAIGDVLTVEQLTVPEGVTILNDPEEAVVSVTPPQAEEAADEAADGEAAEGGEEAGGDEE